MVNIDREQQFAEVRLTVAFNGPAGGLDTQEYADMWQSLYVADVDVQTEPATVGGQSAVLISELPGMLPEQSAFVVANGMKYRSGFVGGPVIVDDPDFGPIRASLVFASAGPAQDQTPRQALESRLEFIDSDSIQDTTVGGAPAVIFVERYSPLISP